MEKFLARQPIFNSDKVVYGYELLFRSGPENVFDGSHADAAAASAVDNLFLFDIERLTLRRRAFVNCTRDFFFATSPLRFPPIASCWKSSRPFSRTRGSSPPAVASRMPVT